MYFGELKIKEKHIRFQNASKFMNDLLNEWLIAYSSKKNTFQIFHSVGEKIINHGKSLMELLDLHPKKGAEYIKVAGAIGWSKVDI